MLHHKCSISLLSIKEVCWSTWRGCLGQTRDFPFGILSQSCMCRGVGVSHPIGTHVHHVPRIWEVPLQNTYVMKPPNRLWSWQCQPALDISITNMWVIRWCSCQATNVDFEIAEGMYTQATIKESKSVCLWLGANVMVEYPFEEVRIRYNKIRSRVTMCVLIRVQGWYVYVYEGMYAWIFEF